MAGEFVKPGSVTPAVAGTLAKAAVYNENFAALGKDSYTGIDTDGAFQDNDLGDDTLGANGTLIADMKVRTGKDLKIYDASANLLNTIPYLDLVNILDFTITAFYDLNAAEGTPWTTGKYYIATATGGIFTVNYIYLKIATGSGWSEIVPFVKQQIYSVTDVAMKWWNGTSWVLVMDIDDDPICKAWVEFNGATAAITDSFNVSGVVRNSVGNYSVSFTSNMPDANYAVLTGGYDAAESLVLYYTTKAVGSVVVVNALNSVFGAADADLVSVAIYSTF